MNGDEEHPEASAGVGGDAYDPYAAAPQEKAEGDNYSGYNQYDADPYAERAAPIPRRGGGGWGRGGDRGDRGDRGRRYGGGGPDRSSGGGPRRDGRGFREKPAVSTKLYVSNLPDTCRRSDLVKLFEDYGPVVECDIVKHYAFIHFEQPDEAKAAADGLNGHDFQGSCLKVELSISRVRQKPGMGGPNECYKCGKGGHWSKDCPTDRGSSRRPSRPSYRDDDYYSRPPPPDPYYRDPYYRDRYPPPPPIDSDSYYRYRPYADPYERRRYPPPPPPPYDDPYYRDPYARPPPDVYSRAPAPRDRYYDYEDPYANSYPSHDTPAAAPHSAPHIAHHAEEAAPAEPAM